MFKDSVERPRQTSTRRTSAYSLRTRLGLLVLAGGFIAACGPGATPTPTETAASTPTVRPTEAPPTPTLVLAKPTEAPSPIPAAKPVEASPSPIAAASSPTAEAQPCNQSKIVAEVPAPQKVGGTYKFTGLSNCRETKLFQWWVKRWDDPKTPENEESEYEMKQGYSPNSHFIWDTTDYPPGLYTVGLWVDSASIDVKEFQDGPELYYPLTK